MPRQARKQSGTDYYHVMIRGINREYVFKTDEHKQKITEIIQKEQQDEEIEVFAWCLMDNHAHLLVKGALQQLSKAIKIISLKYAAYYNQKGQRVGPVFGDRYKSENIEDDQYLLGVLRYIHNNPVKAKMVSNPEDYQWSSYHYYIGDYSQDKLVQDKSIIMEWFNYKKDAFADFHRQQDKTQYLEMKEDREKQKQELAQQIVEGFFMQKGVNDAHQLKNYPELQEDLIVKLKEETALTLREIAEIMGMTLNRVYKVAKG